MALVYHGALQQDLRTYLGRSGATTAVTVLLGGVGSFYALPPYVGDALSRAAKVPGVVLLAVVIAALAAHGGRAVTARLDLPFTPVVAAGCGVLAVAVPLAPAVVLGPPTVGLLPIGVGYALLGGLAAVSYEDTRSVWPPAIALAAFLSVHHPSVSRHVVALLG